MPDKRMRGPSAHQTGPSPSHTWVGVHVNASPAGTMTRFAEADGEKVARTRTSFSLPYEPIFVAAGIWRDTDEWGPAYSMVMTEACIHVADVHDRMPVILRRSEWTDWLHAPHEAAGLLCRPFQDLMVVERTCDPWVGGPSA